MKLATGDEWLCVEWILAAEVVSPQGVTILNGPYGESVWSNANIDGKSIKCSEKWIISIWNSTTGWLRLLGKTVWYNQKLRSSYWVFSAKSLYYLRFVPPFLLDECGNMSDTDLVDQTWNHSVASKLSRVAFSDPQTYRLVVWSISNRKNICSRGGQSSQIGRCRIW